jgi:putative addiction module component (TIGR02574 family)
MPVSIASLGLDRLPREERLALAQELWNSIEAEAGPSLLSERQRTELERRADDADARPDEGTPWEEVKAKASRGPQS